MEANVAPTMEIAALESHLTGHLITPEHPDFAAAHTLFYGGMERCPALIVRAANDEDVARVVAFARENNLELAVRGGGHHIAGFGATSGGILLDLKEMRALDINVEERTAWVEAGVTTGEYTLAAGKHGLATGFGDTGSVGIGGIMLGGGIGFFVRKHGLTIDALLAADIVTADGQIMRVDDQTHPDLFWAIRGGGGNFGVVTRFKFRLHDVSAFYGGMLLLPATADVITGFVAAAEAAPEELTTIASIMKAPPMPFLPPEAHGKTVLIGLMAYVGDPAEGERVLAPFRALATPISDMVGPASYADYFQPEEEENHPTAKSRTFFMDFVDRDAAQTILDAINDSDADMATAQLRVLGGAMARVPVEATAFAHRNSRLLTIVAALFQNGDEAARHEAWVVRLADALRQSDNGAYVNFVGPEGAAPHRKMYPGATRERLREIKRRYDPTNLFRRNHNIPPADD